LGKRQAKQRSLSPLLLGECWLNRGLATLLSSLITDQKLRSSHCKGVTVCLKNANKRLEKGNTRLKLLVVDREEAWNLRRALESFIEKYECRLCGVGKVASAYSCRGGMMLVVLKGPPERALTRLDPSLRDYLENPSHLDLFKNRDHIDKAVDIIDRQSGMPVNADRIDPEDCDYGDLVIRGLCLLYHDAASAIIACRERARD
jgi:hypothetical protein